MAHTDPRFILHLADRLGFGEPLALSASHGDGMAEFATALVPHYEEWEREQQERRGDDVNK